MDQGATYIKNILCVCIPDIKGTKRLDFIKLQKSCKLSCYGDMATMHVHKYEVLTSVGSPWLRVFCFLFVSGVNFSTC